LTDGDGRYAFNNISAGTWQVAPQKSEAVNLAVNALDALYALQNAAGIRALTPQQRLACNVTGSGTVSTLDAATILRFDVGLLARLPAAQACESDWAFEPIAAPAPHQESSEPTVSPASCQSGSITFAPLLDGESNQDFLAVLFGDCTGDWQPSDGVGQTISPLNRARVRLGRPRVTRRRRHLWIPVYVDVAGSFRALDAELHYDPTQLRVRSVHQVGAARAALMAANMEVPGVVRIALASLQPLRSGTVLVLNLDGQSSSIRSTLRVARARFGNT
jgi:hypothetical protein